MCLGLPNLTRIATKKVAPPAHSHTDLAQILKVNLSSVSRWQHKRPLFYAVLLRGVDDYLANGLPDWATDTATITQMCRSAGFTGYPDILRMIDVSVGKSLLYDYRNRTPIVFYILLLGCIKLKAQDDGS